MARSVNKASHTTFPCSLTHRQIDWNPPHVGATYPFHELPDAVRALQSGLTTGKVVVLLSDEECEGQTALKA